MRTLRSKSDRIDGTVTVCFWPLAYERKDGSSSIERDM